MGKDKSEHFTKDGFLMKKYKFKPSTAKNFFGRHGFTLAVTLSVLGLGIAAVATLTALNSPAGNHDPSAGPVDQLMTSVPDLRPTATPIPTKTPAPTPTKTPEISPEPSKTPAATVTPKPEATPVLAYPDYFFLPVNGTVLKDYSDGIPVLSATLGDWRAHNGVDLEAAKGETVVAVADGLVADVRFEAAWGWVVDVDHGGNLMASYRGLDENMPVKQGDRLSAGDTIGTVGEAGYEEMGQASHLHLEMTYGGRYVDPIVIMDKKTA